MQLNDETTAELIAGLLQIVNDYRSSAMLAERKRTEAETALDKAKGETEGVLEQALTNAETAANEAKRLQGERDAARCRVHELEAKQADHIDHLAKLIDQHETEIAALQAKLPPLWSLVLKPVNPDCLPADKWCLVKKESGWWMTKRLQNTRGLDGLTAAYQLPD